MELGRPDGCPEKESPTRRRLFTYNHTSTTAKSLRGRRALCGLSGNRTAGEDAPGVKGVGAVTIPPEIRAARTNSRHALHARGRPVDGQQGHGEGGRVTWVCGICRQDQGSRDQGSRFRRDQASARCRGAALTGPWRSLCLPNGSVDRKRVGGRCCALLPAIPPPCSAPCYPSAVSLRPDQVVIGSVQRMAAFRKDTGVQWIGPRSAEQ